MSKSELKGSYNKIQLVQPVVCVLGLGYVGLPLAEAFAGKLKVIGFDVDVKRIEYLINHHSQQYDSEVAANLAFTTNPKDISQADFIIICVPTPVTKSKDPDLSYVKSAAQAAGRNMKKDSIVILESTVYPGVTEDVMLPILEESGLKCGSDFKIAYSPERINPGDEEHTIDKTYKVVGGMDEETTDIVAALYNRVTPYISKTKDIKTAEAAKVIENIQRDLNIALVNELALIFDKIGLNTREVIRAAATKWNFNTYNPGLIGGHCIPVDPYYLVYKAEELGYHPQVILAGRTINDYMPKHIAEITIKALINTGKTIKGSKVLLMGLTYKENVPDIRETPAMEIVKELKEYGVAILGYDPLLENIESTFGIGEVKEFKSLSEIDGVVLVVSHKAFQPITLDTLKQITSNNPVLIDIRGFYDKEEAERKGFYYRLL